MGDKVFYLSPLVIVKSQLILHFLIYEFDLIQVNQALIIIHFHKLLMSVTQVFLIRNPLQK